MQFSEAIYPVKPIEKMSFFVLVRVGDPRSWQEIIYLVFFALVALEVFKLVLYASAAGIHHYRQIPA